MDDKDDEYRTVSVELPPDIRAIAQASHRFPVSAMSIRVKKDMGAQALVELIEQCFRDMRSSLGSVGDVDHLEPLRHPEWESARLEAAFNDIVKTMFLSFEKKAAILGCITPEYIKRLRETHASQYETLRSFMSLLNNVSVSVSDPALVCGLEACIPELVELVIDGLRGCATSKEKGKLGQLDVLFVLVASNLSEHGDPVTLVHSPAATLVTEVLLAKCAVSPPACMMGMVFWKKILSRSAIAETLLPALGTDILSAIPLVWRHLLDCYCPFTPTPEDVTRNMIFMMGRGGSLVVDGGDASDAIPAPVCPSVTVSPAMKKWLDTVVAVGGDGLVVTFGHLLQVVNVLFDVEDPSGRLTGFLGTCAELGKETLQSTACCKTVQPFVVRSCIRLVRAFAGITPPPFHVLCRIQYLYRSHADVISDLGPWMDNSVAV